MWHISFRASKKDCCIFWRFQSVSYAQFWKCLYDSVDDKSWEKKTVILTGSFKSSGPLTIVMNRNIKKYTPHKHNKKNNLDILNLFKLFLILEHLLLNGQNKMYSVFDSNIIGRLNHGDVLLLLLTGYSERIFIKKRVLDTWNFVWCVYSCLGNWLWLVSHCSN